jgi:thymidylate synthase (FAD)
MFFNPTEYPFAHSLSPLQDNISKVELVNAMMRDPLLTIVNAARVSFNKEVESLSERDIELIHYLFEHEHFSTFRHSYFTFVVKAPLFVFRQWWKHQIGNAWQELDGSGEIEIPETNWNEQSGRYTEFKPEFYIPSSLRSQSVTNRQASTDVIVIDPIALEEYKRSVEDSYGTYALLLSKGVCREQARMLLPQSIYSKCTWTVSLQGLMYWLKLRADAHSQWEIQQYANSVIELMTPILKPILAK